MKKKYHLVKLKNCKYLLVDQDGIVYNNYYEDSLVYDTDIIPTIKANYSPHTSFWIIDKQKNKGKE